MILDSQLLDVEVDFGGTTNLEQHLNVVYMGPSRIGSYGLLVPLVVEVTEDFASPTGTDTASFQLLTNTVDTFDDFPNLEFRYHTDPAEAEIASLVVGRRIFDGAVTIRDSYARITMNGANTAGGFTAGKLRVRLGVGEADNRFS